MQTEACKFMQITTAKVEVLLGKVGFHLICLTITYSLKNFGIIPYHCEVKSAISLANLRSVIFTAAISFVVLMDAYPIQLTRLDFIPNLCCMSQVVLLLKSFSFVRMHQKSRTSTTNCESFNVLLIL